MNANLKAIIEDMRSRNVTYEATIMADNTMVVVYYKKVETNKWFSLGLRAAGIKLEAGLLFELRCAYNNLEQADLVLGRKELAESSRIRAEQIEQRLKDIGCSIKIVTSIPQTEDSQ